MQPKRLFDRSGAVAVTFTVVLFLASAWAGDHETVLYNFEGDNRGGGGTVLVRDAAGNLYGTGGGGIYLCDVVGCGTVFELSRMAGGGWTETVLHNFGNGTDGASPNNLIRDAAGNLYGTTFYSGAGGAGSVYKLSPSGSGDWTETVLHEFGNGADGTLPNRGLVFDAAGNLYGTTEGGGIYTCNGIVHSCGTVFELSPGPGGGWTETVLHSYNGSDGYSPQSGLTMDAAGNLYGTTVQGGTSCAPFGCGTVFELSPGENGGWTYTILYSFNNLPDAQQPGDSLTIDSSGNLYDSTYTGGAYDYGAVFQLSHTARGWTETILYSFDSPDSGIGAIGGVILDRAGDLYGSTTHGGTFYFGTAYELTPSSIRPGASAPH